MKLNAFYSHLIDFDRTIPIEKIMETAEYSTYLVANIA